MRETEPSASRKREWVRPPPDVALRDAGLSALAHRANGKLNVEKINQITQAVQNLPLEYFSSLA